MMKLRYAIMMCSFFFMESGKTQISPGGVGVTNLTAWFRADDLPLGNVTSWSTYYPLGAITVTDPSAPYAQLVNTPAGAVSNYNRTLEFAGNSYSGLNTATLKGLGNSGSFTLLSNAYSGNTGSFFNAYYLPQPMTNNGHMMLYNNAPHAIQLRNLNSSGNSRMALGLLPTNSTNASRDWIDNFVPGIISYKGNRSSSSSMSAYYEGEQLPVPSIASQSSGNTGLYFGYAPTIGTSAYNGFLHECIFFNVDLSANEMIRVHTYLAIKYGVTLNNSGGGSNGDYLATNSALLWDADLNPAYHQDVIGIGRDDAEGLIQRQSHAFDDSCRIYIADLAGTNENNTGIFLNDISYVLMGHNNQALCGTLTANLEVPAGITSRLAREFKVTKTNFSQNFGWDVKLDTCSSIENVPVSQIRLLVDEDGDFTNAIAYGIADGLTIQVLNGTIRITGITSAMIPDNSTRYLTIADVDVSYNLTGSGPVCAGESGYVIFHVWNASAPIDINYSDGTNLFTQNGVEDGDTLFLMTTSTTNYDFQPLISLINCCAGNGQIGYQQVVNDLPLVSAHASAVNLCQGDTLTLTGSGADNYVWDNAVTDNVSFVPAIGTTTYEVHGTDVNGCENTAQISVTVNANPVVSITGPANACIGSEIILNGTGALTYTWNNDVTNGISFVLTASGNYEVVGVDANGCSDTATIDVQALNGPTVTITGSTSLCFGDELVLSGNGASAYTWNNGVVNGVGFVPPLGVTTYEVVGTDVNGCVDTAQTVVTVVPVPVAAVDANPVTGFGSVEVNFVNNSAYGTAYLWDFGNGMTSTDQNVLSVVYDQLGNYQVTLVVSNGVCDSTWTQLIQVLPENATVQLPNICTPNNDGLNDVYFILTENIESIEGQIVNRWGNTVFRFNSVDFVWNPTDMDAGVYMIFYQAKGLNGKDLQGQGFVQIFK